MSFLPAAQREINNRATNDPTRITLEYLMQNGIGRNNPIPLRVLVNHLRSRGINISSTGFQHTILTSSRGGDYFIGSGRRGYFLIETMEDALEVRNFYRNRIEAEQRNLNNLIEQSRIVGWTI